MLPTLEGGGFSRPAGKPYRWHGHHGYRNCFTRRACPARTVPMGGGVVRRALQERPPTTPFLYEHAKPASECIVRGPDGPPDFHPRSKSEGPQLEIMVSDPSAEAGSFGFQTGDMVRVSVPEGYATAGQYIGRVLVRARGSFDVTTAAGRVQGVSHRYCQPLSRSDGYAYVC